MVRSQRSMRSAKQSLLNLRRQVTQRHQRAQTVFYQNKQSETKSIKSFA